MDVRESTHSARTRRAPALVVGAPMLRLEASSEADEGPESLIRWPCSECGSSIGDGEGYVALEREVAAEDHDRSALLRALPRGDS